MWGSNKVNLTIMPGLYGSNRCLSSVPIFCTKMVPEAFSWQELFKDPSDKKYFKSASLDRPSLSTVMDVGLNALIEVIS